LVSIPARRWILLECLISFAIEEADLSLILKTQLVQRFIIILQYPIIIMIQIYDEVRSLFCSISLRMVLEKSWVNLGSVGFRVQFQSIEGNIAIWLPNWLRENGFFSDFLQRTHRRRCEIEVVKY